MTLVADESIDLPIVERLRSEGHSVLYVAEMDPGVTDEDVLQNARQENSLLLVADKDFGELVFRLGRTATGVVLVRVAGLSQNLKAEIVADAFARHGSEFLGAFSVVSPASVRIRRFQ